MMACSAIAVCQSSCSSDGTVEDIEEIVQTDPMRFSARGIDSSEAPQTRAAELLKTDFLVSAWKSYNKAAQQTVMPAYLVKYSEDAWSNTSNWDYVNIAYAGNTQSQKYWDNEGYPYRFHALAPTPADKTGYALGEADLSAGKSTIVVPATYKMQTCTDGTVSPATAVAEPHLLAQVKRDANGKDYDIINGAEINNASASLTRTVALPFHHLTSKVRFAIYTDDLWVTGGEHGALPIKDVTINISSSDFATDAKYSYTVTPAEGSLYTIEGFTGKTLDNTQPAILKYSGAGKTDNDLTNFTSQQKAFFFDCPDGLLQIPQKNVELCLTMNLGGTDKPFVWVPIKVKPSAEADPISQFTWEPGYIYTYYLKITEVNKMEIEFTAVLTQWQDISGSIDTSLEN